MRAISAGDEIELLPAAKALADELFPITQRNLARLGEWLPWATPTYSIDQMREFLREREVENAAGDALMTVIRFRGALCGSVALHQFDRPNRSTSIGYWLDGECQGRGLMTRCCAAMLDYLFDGLDIHRVTIRCGTGNSRSCAIPERLGFGREGVMREAEWINDRWVDLVTWGMLDRDWRARRTAALSA